MGIHVVRFRAELRTSGWMLLALGLVGTRPLMAQLAAVDSLQVLLAVDDPSRGLRHQGPGSGKPRSATLRAVTRKR